MADRAFPAPHLAICGTNPETRLEHKVFLKQSDEVRSSQPPTPKLPARAKKPPRRVVWVPLSSFAGPPKFLFARTSKLLLGGPVVRGQWIDSDG
jgi:hypothetical protein